MTVVEPAGTHLKVPSWMLSPLAARFQVSDVATIGPQALLELRELVQGPLEELSATR